MNKKELVVKYRSLVSLACRIHNLRNCFRIRKTGDNNRIIAPCALLKQVDIRIKGSNNTIIVEDFAQLKGTSIYINGSGNTITVGGWSYLGGTDLFIEDDGGSIAIGSRTKFLGKTHLAVIEGTAITIGEDCLFSSDIQLRTGDSHSVLDLRGCRINASRDIVIGDHVWVGTGAFLTKGAAVAPHSIVGARAMVTKAFDEPNCSLAGVPARVVRTGVDWSIRRIPAGETAPDFHPYVKE
ncbi:MAG: hypothetical protein IJE81_01415 [Oscillospiraceae bacterium]|nr:hypothetical protein [Oscillospiraceae bacterium]MBQ7130180.1 hypothetical protein [Oscillospiraceae bacterium]